MLKANCYECGYRGKNPGSAHIRCNFDWGKSENKPPGGNPHGIKKGWYIFPLNYDPTWMTEECKSFSKEVEKEKVKDEHDPLMEVMAILGSVGRI